MSLISYYIFGNIHDLIQNIMSNIKQFQYNLARTMRAKTRRGNVWEEAPSVVETSFSFSFSFIAVVVVVAAVVVTVGSEPSLQLQKVKEKDCYVLLCKPYMLSLQQHVLISEIRRPF